MFPFFLSVHKEYILIAYNQLGFGGRQVVWFLIVMFFEKIMGLIKVVGLAFCLVLSQVCYIILLSSYFRGMFKRFWLYIFESRWMYPKQQSMSILEDQNLLCSKHCQVFGPRCPGNISEINHKVRESIRHVKISRERQEKFNKMAQLFGTNSHKCLPLDNSFQWNSS